jgi:hypothetical protein
VTEIRTSDWDGIVTGTAADVVENGKTLHSEFPPFAVKRCRIWLARHGRWPFVRVVRA